MKRLTICIALVAALAVPAAAAAGVKTYGGKIDVGGKIGVDARVSGGEVTGIPEFRVKKLPVDCDVSGPSLLNGAITFTPDVPVDADEKFDFDQSDPDGTEIHFQGGFRRHDKVVKGTMQLTISFTGPDEDCASDTTKYSAKRGAPAPKAAARRALRLAP